MAFGTLDQWEAAYGILTRSQWAQWGWQVMDAWWNTVAGERAQCRAQGQRPPRRPNPWPVDRRDYGLPPKP